MVLAEGYKQYNTGRKHMALMGSRSEDPHEEIELDGVGGVSIMVKADVHRAGAIPPPQFLPLRDPKLRLARFQA